MNSSVMISPDRFVGVGINGYKETLENRVTVIQNAEPETWGTGALLNPLWEEIEELLPKADKVVINLECCDNGRIIQLMAEYGLPPDHAVFIMCACNVGEKTKVLKYCGFSSSVILDCECGGQEKMFEVYQHLLKNGCLPDA